MSSCSYQCFIRSDWGTSELRPWASHRTRGLLWPIRAVENVWAFVEVKHATSRKSSLILRHSKHFAQKWYYKSSLIWFQVLFCDAWIQRMELDFCPLAARNFLLADIPARQSLTTTTHRLGPPRLQSTTGQILSKKNHGPWPRLLEVIPDEEIALRFFQVSIAW